MNRVEKKVGLLSILISLGFAGYSLYGIDTIFADKVSTVYSNWQSKIGDDTKISSLYLPGTHNSGARYSFLDVSGQCQDLSIKSQLVLGVRFLDIRLENNSSGLKVVHDMVDQKLTFKKVLSTCYDFLQENNSEFIFMSIKEDHSGNSKTTFEERLKNEIDQDYFVLDTTLPEKIKDVRGKIVLFSRYKDSTIGVDCYSQWLDSTSTTSNSFLLEGSNIYVQDYYQVTSLENKKSQILDAYNYSSNLVLNFTSGYSSSSFPPSNAFSLAKDINSWLTSDLLKKESSSGQVFVSDFITDTLAYAIIEKNFA